MRHGETSIRTFSTWNSSRAQRVREEKTLSVSSRASARLPIFTDTLYGAYEWRPRFTFSAVRLHAIAHVQRRDDVFVGISAFCFSRLSLSLFLSLQVL